MSVRLICVGNVVIDLVMTVAALPERGGDVIASSSTITPGGAFNLMAAARRQGMPVVYAGAHGDGPFGERARAALIDEGIEIAHPATPGVDTGYDVALVEPAGERTFATTIGAEATLTTALLRNVRVDGGDLVAVSGYGVLREPNRSAILGWLAALPGAARVLFDPGPLAASIDARTLEAMRRRSRWLTCNAREAGVVGGADDAAAAGDALARDGWHGVLIRLGADGCLLADGSGRRHRVPGFAVDAIDTNGAGDAHAGVFLSALADGLDPLAAAHLANAAAAIAVTRRGPATAPTRAELDAFLRNHAPDR